MRILAAAHGYPPELASDIALAVRDEVRALAALGHEGVVVAGTSRNDGHAEETIDVDPSSGARVRVVRLSRADLHPAHWQKSLSSSVSESFRALVRSLVPDVLHVHHWSRLTRELVAIAASERVPAVVTLHDAWVSCLIGTRVVPGTSRACDAALGAMPCLACAQKIPPKTPFVPLEAQFIALHEHQRDLVRELTLARAILATSAERGTSTLRYLGDAASALAIVTPSSRVRLASTENSSRFAPDELVSIYAAAIAAGPPTFAATSDAWFAARMRAFAEAEWDRGMSALSRAQQGFDA